MVLVGMMSCDWAQLLVTLELLRRLLSLMLLELVEKAEI
jgi:hypothetical protein